MAPFKTTLARSVGKLLGVYKETDLSLRGDVQRSRVPPPPQLYEALILMVAGGGAGGGAQTGADGGGGGAGEVKYGPFKFESSGSYVFRVGAGGPGASNNNLGASGTDGNGTPTYISSPLFTTVTAAGGGAGGSGPADSGVTPGGGNPGGSGGAGGGDGNPEGVEDGTEQPGGTSTAAPASDSTYYSFTGYGGNGSNGGGDGGGGGGAGGNVAWAGDNGQTDGGAGQPFPAFASPKVGPAVFIMTRPDFNAAVGPTGLYGGGGAPGGEGCGPGSGGPGGGGGGGNAANPGIDYTGGGGSGHESSTAGGNGGGGTIIVRMPTSDAPVLTVPGPVSTVSPGDGYKYFVFRGSTTTSYPVSVT